MAGAPRELLKEIGVIVIGVLIALGAEQVVRSLHERNEIREAREALHAELVNDASTIQIMLLEDQCTLAAADRMEIMAKGGRRMQEPTFNASTAIAPRAAPSGTQMACGGAATHMPLKEKLAYVNFAGTRRSCRASPRETWTSLRTWWAMGAPPP